MKIGGTNRYSQLCAKSNNKNVDGTPIIYPPSASKLNPSHLLSFSIYNEHAIWITREGKMYAIGDNRYHQINESIPKKILQEEMIINIQDQEDKNWQALSAVCGESYTLYLISLPDDIQVTKLAYSFRDHNDNCPLFLSTGDRHPIALFGGSHLSAAIDSEGAVLLITESVLRNFSSKIECIQLPRGEKAVSVACCDDFFLVLSMNGHLFECSADDEEITFSEVVDLAGIKIVEISGSHHHCFAVSKDGVVYGRGSNKQGRLGLDTQIENVDKFTILTTLKKYKICAAYAGYSHSLFLTFNGMVFACGDNYNGNLLIREKPSEDDSYLPTATVITSGASYCIAGWNLSVVFVDFDLPPNSPNKKISDLKNNLVQTEIKVIHKVETKEKETHKVEEVDKERIKELETTVEVQKNKIKELENKILRLKKQVKNLNQNDSNENEIENEKRIKILDSETIHNLRTVRELSKGDGEKILEVAKEESFILKVLKIKNWNTEMQRKLMTELNTLKSIGHPNFLKIFGLYLNDGSQSFLLEYCQLNLHQAVKKNELSNVQIVCSIYQIAEAMKCAHFLGISHKNLKPKNIMINNDGIIKIDEFGSFILKTAEDDKFTAPEIVNNKKVDEKADVYSFGVLMYYLLSGKKPKVSTSAASNGKQSEIPDYFNDFSTELIKKCWNFNPKNRPSFGEICEQIRKNKYQTIDLNKLELKEAVIFIENYKKRIPQYYEEEDEEDEEEED